MRFIRTALRYEIDDIYYLSERRKERKFLRNFMQDDQSSAKRQKSSKMYENTLSRLPMGEDGFVYKRGVKPEGVTSKMIFADILQIALPCFFEYSFGILGTTVDTVMLGDIGSWAITAVGLVGQPRMLMLMVIIAFGTGTTTIAAQYKGRGDRESACEVLTQSLVLSIILGIITTFVGIFFADDMMVFMHAEEGRIFDEAARYMRILMMGAVAEAIGYTMKGALRAVGNSRATMVCSIVSIGVHLFGNALFIYGLFGAPVLGVMGAAIATVAGNVASIIVAFAIIMKKDSYIYIDFKKKYRFNPTIIKQILSISLPAMFEQAILRMGYITFSRTISSLGSEQFAANQICTTLQHYSSNINTAFNVACVSLVGQSIGRRRPDVGRLYTFSAMKLSLAVSLVLSLVFVIFGEGIVSLFNDEPNVVKVAAQTLMVVALVPPLEGAEFVMIGSLRGAGDAKATAVCNIAGVSIVRPLGAILLVNVLGLGVAAAWFAIVIDQSVRLILSLIFFKKGKWENLRRI